MSGLLYNSIPHNAPPVFVIEDNKARSRWKALKAETRVGVEDTELLIGGLQAKVEQIAGKRLRLVQLVQELEEKV